MGPAEGLRAQLVEGEAGVLGAVEVGEEHRQAERPLVETVRVFVARTFVTERTVQGTNGKGGIGAFAPPLDKAGNSVKAQRATRFLSQRLGMDLFVSAPAIGGTPAS